MKEIHTGRGDTEEEELLVLPFPYKEGKYCEKLKKDCVLKEQREERHFK